MKAQEMIDAIKERYQMWLNREKAYGLTIIAELQKGKADTDIQHLKSMQSGCQIRKEEMAALLKEFGVDRW